MKSIEAAMREWINVSTPVRHERTVKWHYIPMMNLYLDIVGNHPLRSFSQSHADQFILGLKANDGLSPVTINNRIKRLKVFLNWAFEREYLDRVPKIPLLKEYRQTPQILTMPEVLQIFKRIGQLKRETENEYWQRCYLMHERFFMVVLATGCRRSEVFYLKWEDIDLGRKVLSIRNQEENKVKEGVEKTVVIPDYLQVYLTLQRQRAPREIYLLDNGQKEILYSNPNAVTKAFNRHFRALGFAGRKVKPLHGFRALFVDRLFNELDVSLDVIQTMLGHSDIRVTQGYLPRTDKRHRGAVKKLNKFDQALFNE